MKGFSGFKESPVKQKPGGSVGEALEHHKNLKQNYQKTLT